MVRYWSRFLSYRGGFTWGPSLAWLISLCLCSCHGSIRFLFFFSLFFKALLGYKVFHTLLYSLRHASMLLAGGFTALILSSFASLSVPSGSILSIPSSNMVLLLRSGEESIFPWMTKNLLSVPRFLFQSVAENSPLTSRSDWSVFSVPPLGFRSLIFFELSLRALNWYSSVMFTLVPLSGSTWASMSPILMSIVSWLAPDLIFLTSCRTCFAVC